MPDQNLAALADATLRLKMNRSMIEMLLDNTPPDAIAKLRREWVEPWERMAKDLESNADASQDQSILTGSASTERIKLSGSR